MHRHTSFIQEQDPYLCAWPCVHANLDSYAVCARDFVWARFRKQVLQALPRNLRAGFFKLVQKVLRVAEGGLLHGGPPCSSFVWMNAGTSCRSKEMPEGRKNVKSVQRANANLGEVKLRMFLHFKVSCSHTLRSNI